MLAEWGAQVIKIESRGGDPARLGFETLTHDGQSPAFQLDNRGKRSVVLDIRKPEGHAALVRLIKNADVFLTNLRPRALKRARIDWETLKTENARLIYASVTGYGLQGAEADLPGYDVTGLLVAQRGGIHDDPQRRRAVHAARRRRRPRVFACNSQRHHDGGV